MTQIPTLDSHHLAAQIKDWAKELGFQDCRLVKPNVDTYVEDHKAWVDAGLHGDMTWLENNQDLRYNPEQLHPGTQTIVVVRMNYLPDDVATESILDVPGVAYVSRYSLGRDYHKLIRKRLTQLGQRIAEKVALSRSDFRAFVDSAPVLERQLAEQSGLGWIGKNTLLLNEKAGSWFFLGELFLNLSLPYDPVTDTRRCGSCTACLDVCPTDAFVSPWQMDARKCISYLTIEYAGSIPESLRAPMGNRIYGCDDCQIFCPFNKFAQTTEEKDFHPRHELDEIELLKLWQWNEQQFLKNTEGSAIRRIGYQQWLRNLAIALGNSGNKEVIEKLLAKKAEANEIAREHIDWAVAQLEKL